MKTIIVTGSAGLIGSECVRYFASREFNVVGIDNDMRAAFFGEDASTSANKARLYEHGRFENYACDIRASQIDHFVEVRSADLVAVIHCAAQPSHDWAASDPFTDFDINARATLNLLQAVRNHAPNAAFIFTSTNKVYGDNPNRLSLYEDETRFQAFFEGHQRCSDCCLEDGINESMSVDQSTHSLFGCSKLAADILVQEYGRYFGMNTVAFRCGCLTGPAHAGAKQHGFLSYLVRCAMTGTPYEIIGYKGKQVRDNLHAADLVRAFDEYLKNPKPGAVYNMGGGRENSCSVIEAIRLVEEISGRKIQTSYTDTPRKGDHQWWISDTRKFRTDYPAWSVTRDLPEIVAEMVESWN